MELTIEISCCKFPHRSRLLFEWDNNIDSLLSYVEQAQLGIRGVAKRAIGGGELEPASEAFIYFEKVATCTPDSDQYNSHTFKFDDSVLTATKDGQYWKVLLPGYYIMQAIQDRTIKTPIGNHTRVIQEKFKSNVTCIEVKDNSQIAATQELILAPFDDQSSHNTESKDITGTS